MRPARALALVTFLGASSTFARGQGELHRLVPPKIPISGFFGGAVAIGNGMVVVGNHTAGKKKHGRAEVFDLATGEHRLTLQRNVHYDQDLFGASIAINDRWLLIGSRHADGSSWNMGAMHVFDPLTGTQLRTITAPAGTGASYFGLSVALQGDLALIGAPGDATHGVWSGAAYLVDVPTGTVLYKWIGSDTEELDQFGICVALSERFAVVGANGHQGFKGAVYVFDLATGAERFELQAHGTYRGCNFGSPLSISGDLLLAGATGEDDHGLEHSGAAYLFDLATAAELRRFSSPAASAWSSFGQGLWLTEEVAIIGQAGDLHEGDERGQGFVFDRDTGQLLDVLSPTDSAPGDNFGWPMAAAGSALIVSGIGSFNSDDGRGASYVFPIPLRSGTETCAGQPNSTGSPAVLRAMGTRYLLANRLTLLASGLPQHAAGSFLVSSDFGFVPQLGGGQGDLCLASPFARFPAPFDGGGGGVARVAVDLTALPGGQVVLPGETWHFQAWYRDTNPIPTSNLTNGMSLTFD